MNIFLKYADPSDIKPNYDVDMDLLGYYASADQTGGQNTWLKKNGNDNFTDDRQVQKYYKSNQSGAYLYAFTPQYNV